mgnify:CR=1 FL=1
MNSRAAKSVIACEVDCLVQRDCLGCVRVIVIKTLWLAGALVYGVSNVNVHRGGLRIRKPDWRRKSNQQNQQDNGKTEYPFSHRYDYNLDGIQPGCVKLNKMENVTASLRKNAFFVFASILSYLVGALLAGFENGRLNFSTLLIGLFVYLSIFTLQQLFNYLTTTKINPYSRVNFERGNKKAQLFILTIVLFMILVFLVYLLLRLNMLIGVNLIFISLLTLLMLMTIFRLSKMIYQTYSLLIEALIVSPLMLLFGTGLQGINPGSGHVLLTVAFFLLYVSIRSSLFFEHFGVNQKSNERSLLDFIGWENGMRLQNASLVLAYLVFAFYFYRNGSLSQNIPTLLTSSFGIFTMYLLNRLARGMKPQWQVIKATAFIHFFSVCYLLIFPLL